MRVYIHGGKLHTLQMITLLDKTIRANYNLYGAKILSVHKEDAVVELPNTISDPSRIVRFWNFRLNRMHWWRDDEDIWFDCKS